MSGEDVLKVVASSAASLVVAFLVYQLQLGGRRRRQRREIREELELIGTLGERPEVAAQLNRRVDALLTKYAPTSRGLPAKSGGLERGVMLTLVVATSIFGGLVFVNTLAPDAPFWVPVLAGMVIGVIGAGFMTVDELRRESEVDLVAIYEDAKRADPEPDPGTPGS